MRLDYIDNIDCLEGLKEVPDNSVDLVATDCPYRIVSGGCTNMSKRNGIFEREKSTTGKLFKCNDIEFSDWLPEVYRVLKENTHCYIFINGRNLKDLQTEAEKVGFQFQNLLIWDKGNVTPNRYYMNGCEFVLMLKKGGARTINKPGTSSVLRYRNKTGEKLHPTEKPVELMTVLIENSTEPCDVVLDPFMGSGTTAVACVRTGRCYIGFELDEEYHAIAMKRIIEEEARLT